MKYPIAFATLAALSFVATATFEAIVPRVGFALAGIAFAIVAVAYATGRPSLLGKRDDGSRAPWTWPLLWPYLLLATASLSIYRLSHRRDAAIAEAAPGVWFARRPTRGDLSRGGVAERAAVLDLAAEFPRVAAPSIAYRSLPLLDGQPVDARTLADAVAWLDAQRRPVLVHCALGHGRTGSVVAAWLVTRGHEPTVDAAIGRLRRLRPSCGLSPSQREAVRRFIDAPIESQSPVEASEPP